MEAERQARQRKSSYTDFSYNLEVAAEAAQRTAAEDRVIDRARRAISGAPAGRNTGERRRSEVVHLGSRIKSGGLEQRGGAGGIEFALVGRLVTLHQTGDQQPAGLA